MLALVISGLTSMPVRKIRFDTGAYYHVFNKTLDGLTIFSDKRLVRRAIMTMWFYRYKQDFFSLSRYYNSTESSKLRKIKILMDCPQLVEIISWCLMPNHFHVLMRQLDDGGVTKFTSNFQRSFAQYYNLRSNRRGVLFMNQFKAVAVEKEASLLQVSRYIHLNPYTSYLVKSTEELREIGITSLPEYFDRQTYQFKVATTEPLLGYFRNAAEWWKFTISRAKIQREMGDLKRLMLEE